LLQRESLKNIEYLDIFQSINFIKRKIAYFCHMEQHCEKKLLGNQLPSKPSWIRILTLQDVNIRTGLDKNPSSAGFLSCFGWISSDLLTDNNIIKSKTSYIVGHFFPKPPGLDFYPLD
jgi:hypothetical protein